jgi:hypothetical protein
MDKLHSAYWFDGIEKNWKLYWEEEWLEYSLEKIWNIENLKVNNWDEYHIVEDKCVFSQNNKIIEALRVERNLTWVGMNFIFYTI